METALDLNSLRARQARLGARIGHGGYVAMLVVGWLGASLAVGLFLTGDHHHSLIPASIALLGFLPALWWKRELSVLPPSGQDLTGRLSVDVLGCLSPRLQLQPQSVWAALQGHWQAIFLQNHLLLSAEVVAGQLSTDEATLNQAWQVASQLAEKNQSDKIELGYVAAALLLTSPNISQLLTQIKAQPDDIEATVHWLGRNLADQHSNQNNYGGIGRDWAFGFTPLLDKLGHNISQGIMNNGAHYGWLTDSKGVKDIETAFDNHTSAVALIGPDGIGKTSSIHALAQRLIEGNTSRQLAYHQIIGLNATDIISRAHGPGELEQIMISVINEAHHAGHIILFFDDAQLFMNDSPGSFDATQILLSIVQAQAVPIILALAPGDYQRLKTSNPSLASLLTPVVLQEMPEPDIMRVLEDTALGLESRNHILVAYEALHEAYRLSGRYEQDEAYPGKAIKLLQQAISHTDNSILSAHSVQLAIEQTRGVKVSSAAPQEADALLHLEDNIHQRMINQTHAVQVVANALRRARAGVTNPRRPIGSFLFLGPTGVGKTELAKAIAATYFGSEDSMVRLDMSEYQQPDDVQRLLSTGQSENTSFLLNVRQQPFSVVLLDEIEKAHPNILNLLLQMLDEGQLTDVSGRVASFKDCVIIATSNAGAQTIRDRVGKGESLESFHDQFSDELINTGQFKPELLNRFDEMVLFRPLNPDELTQVVRLMLNEVNKTLSTQNISVDLTDAAIARIVEQGNDPRLGARPMRRTLQKAVEDTIAQKILKGEAKPGDQVTLDAPDLTF